MKLLAAGLLGILLAKKAYSHSHHQCVHSVFNMNKGDKKAILLVHFGTSKEEAKRKALDSIRERVEKSFPDYEVWEAFTSRMVIRKVEKERGIRIPTPSEALKAMASEGITHVAVQSTHVINGIEHEHLKEEVFEQEHLFKEVRMGHPLLTSAEDYTEVAKIFHRRYPEKNLVLVGHGTPHHAASGYGMLQYISTRERYKNIFIGTVEGYPGIDEILADLSENKVSDVSLIPLMVVAGVHAEEDIAGEWKEAIEEKGISAQVVMEGMGEIPEIQHLFLHHIEDCLHHLPESMKAKKANILKGAM